jgi:hypothetical protein
MRVEGVGDALFMDSDHTFSSLETIGPASLSSLRTAMMAAYSEYDYDYGAPTDHPETAPPGFYVDWTLDSAAEFDDDMSVAEPVSVALLRDGSLVIECYVSAGPAPRTESDTWAEGAEVLSAWLESRHGRLVALMPGHLGFRWFWTVRFEIPIRGRTVRDAAAVGEEVIALLEAFDGGRPSVESLVSMLRAGHANALIGMPESQLLETKRSFHIPDEKAQYELAKDVTAMANSLTGGVIVYGLATKSDSGSDVINAVHPMPKSGQARTVVATLSRRVFPPIEHLDVFFAPARPGKPQNQYLVVVAVPPQPQELRPFLVVGTVVDEKLLGNFLGVFHRRGEDVFASSAASLHAGLSAGLALLRGLASDRDSG